MSPQTVLSLFAGIGGFDLGLQRAGMRIIAQSEINPFCQAILKKHWPEVEQLGDITTIQKFPKADLICGGFPCQPVSIAGRRKGSRDKRWMWPEFYRAICQVRPRWAIIENVPGLLSADRGRLFAGILRDFAAIGYDAEWRIISAADLGAPHLRKRLIIIAYPHSIGSDWTRKKRPRRPESSDSGPHPVQPRLAFGGAQKPRFGLQPIERSNWWDIESDLDRVAHGVPCRVDRIRALGNAIVPQVAEYLGSQIINAMSGLK